MVNPPLAQFFVVIRDGSALSLQRVPVTAALQKDLADDFFKQMGEFLSNKQPVGFSPSYRPDSDEILRIANYALPPFLQQAVTSPHNFPSLTLPFTSSAPWVKAILV